MTQRQPLIGKHCLIFGGNGYIGTSYVKYILKRSLFERVTLADVTPPRRFGLGPKVVFQYCDVRKPIASQIDVQEVDWIINAAAVHREPGHRREEYFDTNVGGARNVCSFAEHIGVNNLLFTSSIAVYGPTPAPTDETWPCYPDTAYGASKLVAEQIHSGWQHAGPNRRLITVRPGVVYGPGDAANMLRLIHALQLGIFVLPGDPMVRKSYAYIEGLCEAFEFAMRQPDGELLFNYVDKETQPLIELVRTIQKEFSLKSFVPRLPSAPLELIAQSLQVVTLGRSPIHPDRVRKVSRPTHIVPQLLMNRGFDFRYGFEQSLKNWRSRSPQDFLPASMTRHRYLQMRAAAVLESILSRPREI
jgi:nucleoside-diphosphate-sugar epimerase